MTNMTYYSHCQKYKKPDPITVEYLIQHERSMKDFTNLVPNKSVEKERLPWGFYGYTYLGHNKMWLNEQLDETPYQKLKTDIHESIHTPDEYETRVLTDWMLDFEPEEKLKEKIIQKKSDYQRKKGDGSQTVFEYYYKKSA